LGNNPPQIPKANYFPQFTPPGRGSVLNAYFCFKVNNHFYLKRFFKPSPLGE
jgi:hypothetical protein